LSVLEITPAFFIPFLQDFIEFGRGRLIINNLNITARDVERFGYEVGDIFPNEHVGIEMRGIDFFGEI